MIPNDIRPHRAWASPIFHLASVTELGRHLSRLGVRRTHKQLPSRMALSACTAVNVLPTTTSFRVREAADGRVLRKNGLGLVHRERRLPSLLIVKEGNQAIEQTRTRRR